MNGLFMLNYNAAIKHLGCSSFSTNRNITSINISMHLVFQPFKIISLG